MVHPIRALYFSKALLFYSKKLWHSVLYHLKLFFQWANPGLFFIYFQAFQTNNTIIATNQCEKMSQSPSSIRRRDSNPQPFEHESSPLTTRPGLPPITSNFISCVKCNSLLCSTYFPPIKMHLGLFISVWPDWVIFWTLGNF